MAVIDHVEFWVQGQRVGTPVPDQRVGHPICMGCEQTLDTGLVFRGDGSICRHCLDELREELWKHFSKVVTKG